MKKIIITAIAISAIAACKTKKDTSATTAKPTINCATPLAVYASDIKPIMETNCTKCHNENNKAGYNFLTIESVKKAGMNGELLRSIKHEPGIDPMPAHADKLDDATINKIECWINNGMK